MTIERKQVEQVARLARLAIDEKTIDDVGDRLNRVLGLVDQLQAADTQGIEPMAHPLHAQQPLRNDEVTETNHREAFQAIAPATEDGLYLVPKVIE